MHASGSVALCIRYEAIQRGFLNIPFEFSSKYRLRTTPSPFSLPPTSLYHPSCLQELTLPYLIAPEVEDSSLMLPLPSPLAIRNPICFTYKVDL